MRRTVPAAVLALLVAGSLAGCTASAASGSSGGGSSAASGAASVDFEAGRGRMPVAKSVPAERSVVTTARLHLVDTHPVETADRIRTIVEGAAGRIATSREDPTGRASADLVARIPAAGFDAALTAIEHTGSVRDVSVDASDVTSAVTDTAVRIATLRTSIARLQQLLGRAQSSSALVQLEGALTDRQTTLEQLLAQQRTLSDQVADATLTISIVTPAAAPKAGPDDFAAGFVVGLHGLVRTVAAALVGFGVVLPWLVLAGAVTAVVVGIRRLVRRRARSASA